MKTNGSRKSPFANVHQIGVIVANMDEAVAFYEELGIGPFQELKGTATIERQVYGKPAPDVSNRVSTAQMGAVQFEIVQPISGRSVQREYLERRGEGVNHLGFLVDHLDEEVAQLTEKGFQVISSGKTIDGGASAYLSTDKIGGVIFELIQEARNGR